MSGYHQTGEEVEGGEAMTAFVGGQRGSNVTQNRWQQKYNTMRANKIKADVISKMKETTGNTDDRTQRPNAMSMLKNFYVGYKNPDTREQTMKRGRPMPQGRRFEEKEFYSSDKAKAASTSKSEEGDTDTDHIGDGGIVGDLMDRQFVTMDKLPPEIRKQLRVKYDHRPYFTMWVMFVNIVIMIITLCTQSIAPVGFTDKQVTKQLLRHNLAYETVGYNQTTNFWIGPDYQSLIHLGAKYSPCMRVDKAYMASIASDVATEDTTGCCIRNDLNACWQSPLEDCSSSFSAFLDDKVCGLGKLGCQDTAYNDDVLWEGTYSTWPNCPIKADYQDKIPNIDENANLRCEVSARPCCIGLQGECVIISQEECEFKQGFFHEDSTLCSQVSCVTDICGLSGFLFDNTPDQFYRALLPTFMHAGILHLLITLIFQFTILRDMEKLAGWWRIGFIYMASGVGGTMLSAILIPYQPEVGASGALYGLLAALVVEIVVNWKIFKSPIIELIKLILLICILLLAGLLPWIDNFAHIGGFLFGFLTSFLVLPHVNFNEEDRIAKLVVQIVCGVVAVVLFVLLFIVFYLSQGSSCVNCSYLNCIPFTAAFCQDSTMELRPRLGN